jgi:hypothetical protein
MKALTGGCSCGEIRYRLTNNPLVVHACHCRDCQKITGSAFVINMWIERQYFEASGAKPKSYLTMGGSGKEHEASFCGKCGTYVWSRYSIVPANALFVRAGTLDNPKAVKPDYHLFTRYKLPWVVLPEGAPAFKSFYKIDKVWPATRKERFYRSMKAQSSTKNRSQQESDGKTGRSVKASQARKSETNVES